MWGLGSVILGGRDKGVFKVVSVERPWNLPYWKPLLDFILILHITWPWGLQGGQRTKETRGELFLMQGVLLEAPTFSSEARKLVPLAPTRVALGTRAVFCSRALQRHPIRTLSVHHGFFKHIEFAYRENPTSTTLLSYAAHDIIIPEQISLHRWEVCPIFAGNSLDRRPKHLDSSFFRL